MKIAVSACLLGDNCKYNAGNNKSEAVLRLAQKHTLVPICPEVFGGLPTPRTPCEIKNGKVISKDGEDMTAFFLDGAEKALYVAEEKGCQLAILKERSPSCGFGMIYDGSFTGTLVRGNGITAELFYNNGIRIINEKDVDQL